MQMSIDVRTIKVLNISLHLAVKCLYEDIIRNISHHLNYRPNE